LTLSVGDLAGKFSCSRRHLNRLFHLHFGFSVAALRMEMRLLKAVSLLRNPSLKVISVAQQCGFNHLGLFNTCFKRRFGSSPGQWRKTGLQSSGQSLVAFDGSLRGQSQATNLRPAIKATDLSAPIRAKVYEILRKSHASDVANSASRGIADTNVFSARPTRNRSSSTKARYRSPP
jgi:AraC-like DNA-binding protein